MKHCKKSYKCSYGNAFEKYLCAYRENMEEQEPCPALSEHWEEIIDTFQTEPLERIKK